MKSYNNIQNFVLDFGGVLYDINHKATFKAFFNLANQPDKFSNYDMKQYLNDELIIQFEKGLISPKEFRLNVKKKFSIISDDESFDKAFNATLVNLKNDAISNVGFLKNIGKVFLLSNTNEIHYNHFKNECQQLFDLFDGLFFSFLLSSRKPDSEIFISLINETGINVRNTLFVDDSDININTAKELEFNTYLVDSSHSLSDLIQSI